MSLSGCRKRNWSITTSFTTYILLKWLQDVSFNSHVAPVCLVFLLKPKTARGAEMHLRGVQQRKQAFHLSSSCPQSMPRSADCRHEKQLKQLVNWSSTIYSSKHVAAAEITDRCQWRDPKIVSYKFHYPRFLMLSYDNNWIDKNKNLFWGQNNLISEYRDFD